MARLAPRSALPPDIEAPVPGPRGHSELDTLAATECPSLTARRARRSERLGAPFDPIVWEEASGVNVVDVDGNRFVDLTGGFGVATIGHRHPAVVRALERASGQLLHALGDLHPSAPKVRLLARLAELAPWPEARAILGVTGSDAVDAALKTALLATGRPGVLAFEGGYHGLAHGPLAACGYDEKFRAPFRAQLNPHVVFAPWPTGTAAEALARLEALWPRDGVGAVVIEPVQGRAGVRVPPPGFLAGLVALAHAKGALLVADEIFTGLGRCGTWWRSVDEGARPDVLCVGKALGGGLPVSACLARADVMQAWGAPGTEALYTGTFFGNPLACATALACLDVLTQGELIADSAARGARFADGLREVAMRHRAAREVRGVGMMLGLALRDGAAGLTTVRRLLEHGYLVLPAGADGEVVQLLPSLDFDASLWSGFLGVLDDVLSRV